MTEALGCNENLLDTRLYFNENGYLSLYLVEFKYLEPQLAAFLRQLHELNGTTVVSGAAGKLATWKPNILLVQDDKLNEVERIICPWPSHRESADGRHACTILDRAQKPRLKEILAVYSSGKDDKRNVFVFPAAEVSSLRRSDLFCSP